MFFHHLFKNTRNKSRYTTLLLIATTLALLSLPVFADSRHTVNIDWANMTMKLLGGLALFLFGMEQMAESLKAVAGERMRGILAKLTTNRFTGAATGAFVTAVIQSSSITTVLLVGFISAGLMTLSQSVGIIMGANIGTTITAQIVAFKVSKAALLMIAVGFSLLFACKQERIKHYGAMLMGLGLVFFGMSIMGEAMNPLRNYPPFLNLMIEMENPLVGILVAAAFTGLIQSSSATTGIIIVMASQGFITLPAGIALAFGANIGTCVTALLASIGKPREAVRAAMVHVIFNVAGVLVWVYFIPQLASFVSWFSPAHPELTGISRLSAETPRQIANAHTIFNIANTLLFIGFTVQFARLVEWLIPDRTLEEEGQLVSARYLDEELLTTPSLALDRVRLEVLHMGDQVQLMLQRIMPAILGGDRESLNAVANLDDKVDILYEQIVDYLGQISKRSLTDQQMQDFLRLMAAVSNLENIGDVVETNMVTLGKERIEAGFSISQPTKEVLNGFQDLIKKAVDGAIQAVSQSNKAVALSVIAMKQKVNFLAESAAQHHARRLVVDEPNRIIAYTIEVDIIEKQKRIYYFAKRMAKTVLTEDNGDKNR
ncbi:MAG: Na/Pi cotransporter family protein [gamma proteobacterium symbiont of Bathyaustriella thionipta]|nr:Na/Pi cotransporter family protein [gamma proteobacterium symbiont of Bathyaustriella thionipta]